MSFLKWAVELWCLDDVGSAGSLHGYREPQEDFGSRGQFPVEPPRARPLREKINNQRRLFMSKFARDHLFIFVLKY